VSLMHFLLKLGNNAEMLSVFLERNFASNKRRVYLRDIRRRLKATIALDVVRVVW
jgi:hypothetical protein